MHNTNIDKIEVNINFKMKYKILLVGLLILILVVVGIILLDNLSNINIIFSDYIFVVSAGFVGISVVYAAASFQYAHQNNLISSAEKKKMFAYSIISEWNKKEMSDNYNTSKKFYAQYKDEILKNNNQALVELETALNKVENLENKQAFYNVLNYFEVLSTYINENLIEEQFAKKFFRGVVVSYYKSLKNYIDHLRKKENNDLIWEHFYNLAKKWYDNK